MVPIAERRVTSERVTEVLWKYTADIFEGQPWIFIKGLFGAPPGLKVLKCRKNIFIEGDFILKEGS